MTYVVHLWEHTAPDTLKAAQALHERLSGTPPPNSAKFGELAQALIHRFPVEVGGATAPVDSEDGEPGEWVESTPDGVSGSAVYSLALYGDGLDQLLPFLIDTATALGLTVYDDQAGQAFLPGGWVLDEEGLTSLAPRETQVPVLELLTPTLVKTALKAFAAAHFKPLGLTFKVDRFGGSLRRKTPVGEQVLTIQLAETSGVRISLAAQVVPTLPSHIAEITDPQTSIYLAFGPCTALQAFAEHMGGIDSWPTFNVYYPQDLQRWLEGYAEMVRTELLPLLDASRDAAGVLECDAHVERYPAHFKPSVIALALARAVGVSEDDWLRRVEEFRARQAAQQGGIPVHVSEPRIAALAMLSDMSGCRQAPT